MHTITRAPATPDPALALLDATERVGHAAARLALAWSMYGALLPGAPARWAAEDRERIARAGAELDAATLARDVAQDVPCPGDAA